MRIPTLLQQIKTLAESTEPRNIIDVDLMLDYTRVLYADLLEWRSQLAPKNFRPEVSNREPTLDELTEMMLAREREETIPPTNHQTVATMSEPEEEAELIEEKTVLPEISETEHYVEEAPPVQVVAESLTNFRPEPAPIIPVIKPAEAIRFTTASSDIRTMININEKYQLMSELFGNDKAGYEGALDKINLAENAEEASNWLQERLWVTEEQKEVAQAFYDLIKIFKKG
ncbi:MAG: hypothetical protein ABI378_11465 [Chitinophagaceae bacterium]